MRAPKVCSTPGCLGDADRKSGKCSEHAEPAWVRSRRRDLQSPAFRRNRLKALRRTGGRCAFCATVTPIVDHRLPLAWGGTDDLENLQPLCEEHHGRKTKEESVVGRRIAAGDGDRDRMVRAHVEKWTPAVLRYR